MDRTALILGAGATKACGGPLTNEILPEAFKPAVRAKMRRENYDTLLNRFLVENFHVPTSATSRKPKHYPALPLLISLIDTAIDRKQPLGPRSSSDQLVDVREALEYIIFALLDYKLKIIKRNLYLEALEKIYGTEEPKAISLNYDIIIDNAMAQFNQNRSTVGRFPSYGCEIRTKAYASSGAYYGKLLKLH